MDIFQFHKRIPGRMAAQIHVRIRLLHLLIAALSRSQGVISVTYRQQDLCSLQVGILLVQRLGIVTHPPVECICHLSADQVTGNMSAAFHQIKLIHFG